VRGGWKRPPGQYELGATTSHAETGRSCQYDWSLASGWKVGGFADWSLTDCTAQVIVSGLAFMQKLPPRPPRNSPSRPHDRCVSPFAELAHAI
jgi:hypothetical protein